MKHRFSHEAGFKAAALFILMISTMHLFAQTYQLLAFVRTPHDLPQAISLLEQWFDGLTVYGYQFSAPAIFPLILILPSIIALALLELKPSDKKPADFVV